MWIKSFRYLLVFFFCLAFIQIARADSNYYEEQVLVSMRVIGHELMVSTGDEKSRILPITKEDDRYKIQFESNFSFDPDILTNIVDSVVAESKIASDYMIEVKDCDSGLVVYSYRMNLENPEFFGACKGRIQPVGCYFMLVRIISPAIPIEEWISTNQSESTVLKTDDKQSSNGSDLLYFLAIGLAIVVFFGLRLKQKSLKKGTHQIAIGSYLFDHKKMILIRGSEKQELTGKETDLLQLLYSHLNSTVDRDVLLKEVWRDEGAYIGRTLDVYISKLRKKFETDPSISIINVRGVGYKLTLD